MGLFKSYEREDTPAEVQDTKPPVSTKKTVPTPSRRDAEAARRQRLKPELNPKQAKARERQIRMENRAEQLQKMDSEPGRVLLRDHIDARRSLSQWALPIVMVSLAFSMFASGFSMEVYAISMYSVWAIFGAIIVDIVLMWRGYKKLHAQRLPNESTKGLMSYGFNRAINIRRFRRPPPRVSVGQII
ncbi:MAG: DUF3043 domain-containing protein [Propionibacteriaceae bacterium]|nr:DUF3043 domain-containing protein [Propionibacteriaceae bacterium]